MRPFSSAALLLLSVTPIHAHARDAGVELAVRGGVGVVSSNATAMDRLVPLWAEVGYRIDQRVVVGGYFQYGVGRAQIQGLCTAGAGPSCSGHDLRAGAEVMVRPLPEGRVSPWVGVGAGYVSYNATGEIRQSQLGLNVLVAPVAFSTHAIEAMIQGGVDAHIGAVVLVGPYCALFTAKGGALEGGIRLTFAP